MMTTHPLRHARKLLADRGHPGFMSVMPLENAYAIFAAYVELARRAQNVVDIYDNSPYAHDLGQALDALDELLRDADSDRAVTPQSGLPTNEKGPLPTDGNR